MAAKKKTSKPGPTPKSEAEGRTVEDFEEFLRDLDEIRNVLMLVIEDMGNAGMERLFIPSESQFNHHLPKMWDWSLKLQSEFKKEVRAFRLAKRKRAEETSYSPEHMVRLVDGFLDKLNTDAKERDFPFQEEAEEFRNELIRILEKNEEIISERKWNTGASRGNAGKEDEIDLSK